jgi:4a-hydroxytetrahydrobiopterin dehydratase
MNTLLSEIDIENSLKSLPGWKYVNNCIVKTFKTTSFPVTMGFITALGGYCQYHNHHPDYILVKFIEIEVAFSTHSLGGVTDKDIKIALDVEKLPL